MASICADYAKSGRSRCKGCKETIAKDALRIGLLYDNGDFTQTHWKHYQCFSSVPKPLKDFDYKTKIAGVEDLSIEDQQLFQNHVSQVYEGTFKKARKQQNKKDKLSYIISNDSDNKVPLGYTDGEYQKFREQLGLLQKKGNKELQSMLKVNNQPYSGMNKGQLIEKIADGIVLGQIPCCPKCQGGKPKFDSEKSIYHCKGYMDDANYVVCNKKFQKDEIQRLPWEEI